MPAFGHLSDLKALSVAWISIMKFKALFVFRVSSVQVNYNFLCNTRIHRFRFSQPTSTC